MSTNAMPSDSGKLRVTIHIDSTLLLLKGAELPAEAIHIISNKQRSSDRQIYLRFGENEQYTDNVQVEGFKVNNLLLSSQEVPSEYTLKISVSAEGCALSNFAYNQSTTLFEKLYD